MGTRANIGMVNEDGTAVGIYTHWDGYPSHHVPILTENYTTDAAVRDLLALGDLSQLHVAIGERHSFDAPAPGWCVAYGRDRGETGTEAKTFSSESEFNRYANNEYAYLYKAGEWLARTERGDWTKAVELVRQHEAM